MISFDEDALICDLAETYQIYDYRSLPVKLVATLAAGLRDNSRIKLLASGLKVNQDTILLAGIADRIDAIRYGFSEDAQSIKQMPSLVRILLGEDEKTNNEEGAMTFDSPDELKKTLARIRGEL